ncbi:MAG: hypothetical protein SOZ00_05735 [Tidjanibacter sp.]|nr:hypothetical protein [Tidjanibacter sp.]
MFAKFERAVGKWFTFIDMSFLPNEIEERYKPIIADKLAVLGR